MSARLIDGAALGKRIRQEVAAEVAGLVQKSTRPGLAVILVGDDPASAVYVRNKGKACEESGMKSVTHHLPAATSQEDLLGLIESYGVAILGTSYRNLFAFVILIALLVLRPNGLFASRRQLPPEPLTGTLSRRAGRCAFHGRR